MTLLLSHSNARGAMWPLLGSQVGFPLLALCAVVFVVPAQSAPVRVEVVTQILAFDPQAGMKSTQVVEIDFESKKVSTSFKTGVTHLGSTELTSVRDMFIVDNADFSAPGRVGITLKGETASGVYFMPNINYKFVLAVTAKGGGALSGCHDGYPAYQVKVGSKTIYDFKHRSLGLVKLFGECDIELKTIDF